jgi:hypothetical protein
MTRHCTNVALAAMFAALAFTSAPSLARAEDGPNAAPNPYRTEEKWASCPKAANGA